MGSYNYKKTYHFVDLYRMMFWFGPDGEYTVQTDYKFLQNLYQASELGQSNATNLQQSWKKIWSLKVLGKVKNQVWRACKNSLPTKTNLVKHQIVTSGLCEICKLYPEDTNHALYHCLKVEKFWENIIPLWNHGTIRQSTSFLDIMFVICVENRDPKLVSSVVWALWNRRNNLRLGKPLIPLD